MHSVSGMTEDRPEERAGISSPCATRVPLQGAALAVRRDWESNRKIKSREAPGCCQGWEPAGNRGPAGHWQGMHPSVPLSCALAWPGTPLGRGWLIPRAATGLGVARGPLLIPRASLTRRARDAPWEGTSFLKQDLLPPRCTSSFPGGRGSHNSAVTPMKSVRDTQGKLLRRRTPQRGLPTLFAHQDRT